MKKLPLCGLLSMELRQPPSYPHDKRKSDQIENQLLFNPPENWTHMANCHHQSCRAMWIQKSQNLRSRGPYRSQTLGSNTSIVTDESLEVQGGTFSLERENLQGHSVWGLYTSTFYLQWSHPHSKVKVNEKSFNFWQEEKRSKHSGAPYSSNGSLPSRETVSGEQPPWVWQNIGGHGKENPQI